MELTSNAVDDLVKECLFEDEEDKTNALIVEGVLSKFGFDPVRVEKNKENIRALLMELPDQFLLSKGGGSSFLNAVLDRHGNQWGEHINVDYLLCLGLASKLVSFVFPRKLWGAFPGGMPYFVFNDALVSNHDAHSRFMLDLLCKEEHGEGFGVGPECRPKK